MDHLIALPVKGEAFLLRRGIHSILVDSGWNGLALSQALNANDPNLSRLDIVVCTHADRDHATGFATFFEHWFSGGSSCVPPRSVGQLWLPGRWADIISELLRTPDTVVNGLITQLDQICAEQPDFSRFHEGSEGLENILAERVRAERGEKRTQAPDRYASLDDSPFQFGFDDPDIDLGVSAPSEEPGWLRELRAVLDNIPSTSAAAKLFQSGRNRIHNRKRRGSVGEPLADYWLGLIDAAANIRAIAATALERRIRIRWFDFDEFSETRRARGGVRHFLIPLNSVEQIPMPQLHLSYLARLSPVNEACLAFLAPPSISRLGVAFCGDSPLGDGAGYGTSFLPRTLGPSLPIVATAPHHGSENNRVAYGHLVAWADVRAWLRTGGDRRQPGGTFKSFRFPMRLCSHCPQKGLKLQTAAIAGTGARLFGGTMWLMGHFCSCA
jgi:hypothetical protein